MDILSYYNFVLIVFSADKHRFRAEFHIIILRFHSSGYRPGILHFINALQLNDMTRNDSIWQQKVPAIAPTS